jgi:hypothetical protein
LMRAVGGNVAEASPCLVSDFFPITADSPTGAGAILHAAEPVLGNTDGTVCRC